MNYTNILTMSLIGLKIDTSFGLTNLPIVLRGFKKTRPFLLGAAIGCML